MEAELTAAEVAPTVLQLTTATVVTRKRHPLATLFRRLVGVIAGIAFLRVLMLGLLAGWSIVSGIVNGTPTLGWQETIIGLFGAVVGGLLFWIARWGLDV